LFDPCRLVRPVKQFMGLLPAQALRNTLPAAELLHLPDEPAGVGKGALRRGTSRRPASPAGRAGRGRLRSRLAFRFSLARLPNRPSPCVGTSRPSQNQKPWAL